MNNQIQFNQDNTPNKSFFSTSNIIPQFINSTPNNIKVKKRNYNEYLQSYKELHINSYLSETEGLQRSLNLKYKKNLQEAKDYYSDIHTPSSQNILADRGKQTVQKKKLNLDTKKKFMYDEDFVDFNEKDFSCEKKYGLSKSYLYDEGSGFNSDLDDTKENSFFSVNISFDYPEINIDKNIHNKLITNALEIEKTFNRIFNVKNMPNKK